MATQSWVFVTDIECGGGFYVRSLVDDLGKGEAWISSSAFLCNPPANCKGNETVLVCCSSFIVCSCERTDPDQAGPVHPGGARLAGGALDTGTYPASSAAVLRRIVDIRWLRDTFEQSSMWSWLSVQTASASVCLFVPGVQHLHINKLRVTNRDYWYSLDTILHWAFKLNLLIVTWIPTALI